MKNCIWKYRIVLGFLVLLLVQVPFVVFKLTIMTADRGIVDTVVEVTHILISSGLAGYLFSKAFESLLENWLYGGFLRRNWKEVRVLYSDNVFKGMGEAYPREPTLIIQPPMGIKLEASQYRDEDSLVAQSLDGKSYVVTATTVHGPMSVSFNTGYVGRSAVGKDAYATGKWSDLQLMQVGHPGIVRVGFPDTLIELRKPPT